MANMAARMTGAFFDSKGLSYEVLGNDGEVIRAGFAMDNREGIRVLMFFDDDSTGVKIRAFDLVKFPPNKKEAMYKICNEMNSTYRWIKFFVDEKDNTIVAEDDAVIQLDSCGEEVFRCCLQLVSIADDAYPEFMKYIWGAN